MYYPVRSCSYGTWSCLGPMGESFWPVDKCLIIHFLSFDLEHLSCSQDLYCEIVMHILVVFLCRPFREYIQQEGQTWVNLDKHGV